MSESAGEPRDAAEPRAPSRLALLLRGLLAVVLIVAAVTARVLVAGERAIEQSTEALRLGDASEAIARAREAASWYAPGAPHVRVAYGRLFAVAREAERRKLRSVALEAYRSVTTASASTRWIVSPYASDALRAREAIARLESTGERAPAVAAEPSERIERAQLAALTVRERDPAHALALVGTLLALAAGLATLLLRGIDAAGRFDRRRALPGLALSAAGLVGYAMSLLLA